MDSWKQYLAGIICFICFCRLFEQFLPGKDYRKYIRFFLGLLLLVLCLTPILQKKNLEAMFEQNFNSTKLREEGIELKQWQEDASALQTKVIQDSFKNRLQEQITQIAKAKGMPDVVVKITELGEDELLSHAKIQISGSFESDMDEAQKQQMQKDICLELKTIYGILESQVKFHA